MVHKTVFLYFIELMGIEEQDTLNYLCTFIAKNHDEKKITKTFDDSMTIQFDKLVFFSQDKKSLVQKKLLKRFIKFLTSNIVDGLPQKED